MSMYLFMMSTMQYKFTKSVGRESRKGRCWSKQLMGKYVPQVSLEMLAGAAVLMEEEEGGRNMITVHNMSCNL